MNIKLFTTATITAALLYGCSTVPERIDTLEQARSAVHQAEQQPMAEQVAGNELEQARTQLDVAENAYADHEDTEFIRHHAYLALRHAEIVEQRVAEARLREQIEDSKEERQQVLLQARERDALKAEALAQARSRDAAHAQALAEAKAREAENNRLAATRARAEAESAKTRAERLEAELAALKAEETERGMVMTLGDVLFDFDKATLKPGASMTLDRLAAFLKDYPKRALLIEGHTDSRGDDAYNRELSAQRAAAVREALIRRGVSPSRLETVGLGEAFPVATNDTVAGRQQNRRVEIVISDRNGTFPESVRREIAQN